MTSPKTEKYDVVVIGGGINGTAIARGAAIRGYSTLLLEKNDLGSAASAWNSRLIHGGLKYLETFEIGLVRESLRDREWLLRTAPHLVQPIPMTVPFLKRNKRGPLMLGLGMIAYDALSFDKSTPLHRLLSKSRALDVAPGIDVAQISGGVRYYEAQVEHAERLSVENALSAREWGAQIRTHATVDRLLVEGDVVTGVRFMDGITGRENTVSASVVVNAAGSWVDTVLSLSGEDHERLMGGTSGTHFIVEDFPGAPKEALYYEAVTDGRPLMVIPWMGRYLIGSTDQRYEGDANEAVASDYEVDYILRETNGLFPGAGLTKGSVLFSYTGIRPLPHEPGVPESKITRSHMVRDHGPRINGLFSIVGGKLTTFRTLGKDVVRVIEKKLGTRSRTNVDRIPYPGSRTTDFVAFAEHFRESTSLPDDVADRLASIYGTRASEIEALVNSDSSLGERLWPGRAPIAAEVVFVVRTEFARSIEDVVMRRMMLGFDPDFAVDAGEVVGRVLRQHLDWSAERVAESVRGYVENSVRFRPPSVTV